MNSPVFWKDLKRIVTGITIGITIIGTIGALIYGFPIYLENQIEKKILDPEFLNEVSSKVRPYVIFDGNGSILVDGGGM